MERSYDVGGPVSLEITFPAGVARVQAVEADELQVRITGLEGAAGEAAAESARVDFREWASAGAELLIDIEDEIGGSRPSVRIEVRCPSGSNLALTTASGDTKATGRLGFLEATSASGDVDVEALDGSAQVTTASGDVKLGSVDGDVTVQAASGDVEIGTAGGATKVRAASGDVTIRRAGSAVSMQTASGDQRIDSVAAGQLKLRSASGDIQVGIARGSSLWVDARSLSGETSSELDVGDLPSDHPGGPLVEMRATAMSGDIRVVHA